MKKTLEEHLLGLVKKWREIELDDVKGMGPLGAMDECADDLQSFVYCNPELKDLKL